MRTITRTGLLLTLLLLPAPAPGQDGSPWDQGVVLENAPSVLPERHRVDVVNRILEDRLENLLPRLMRETGMHALEVLQTANLNSAKLLGEKRLGLVRPGYLADLVASHDRHLSLEIPAGHGLHAGA